MADIRAETLFRKSNTLQVNDTVSEIYKSITHKVREAHESGAASVMYELPDNFEIGCMELADAQLVVYSRLVERVEANGLQVNLIPDDNGSMMMKIAWPSMLDPTEKERMKEIIKKHLTAS